MRKVKTEKHGIVHRMATCMECEWRDEDFRSSPLFARQHCEKTGHRVRVETGTVTDYYSNMK